MFNNGLEALKGTFFTQDGGKHSSPKLKSATYLKRISLTIE
jgi:hypothetical protein